MCFQKHVALTPDFCKALSKN